MTAKILDEAGFDPTGSKEKSDWGLLVDFLGQYWRAGEVPGKIEDYRKQLSEAMDLLLVWTITLLHVGLTRLLAERSSSVHCCQDGGNECSREGDEYYCTGYEYYGERNTYRSQPNPPNHG